MNTLLKLLHKGKNIVRRKLSTFTKVNLENELMEAPVKTEPIFPLAFFRSRMTGSKETADKICRHEFDILGSGMHKLAKHINWQAPFGEGKDIKLAWELSRFQFLGTLAKAYEIHNSDAYAMEAKELIHDWIMKNQFGTGINWDNAMEVAIRACNFALAWRFLKNSKPWKEGSFEKIFLKSIVEHGKFIFRNLEYGPGFNTNHLIADLTGLLSLGILFPQFKEARAWKAKAIFEMEKQIKTQVYEDGVDFEASIPYHRLVCELFGESLLLCDANEIMMPEDFRKRLEEMFEFTWYYTKPNGLAPQIGDNDDGRLFIFEDFYSWERRDHRHILRLGKELFPNNPKFAQDQKPTSRGFNLGGVYVMRKDDFYCIVDCGENGQAGNAGHAHNDTLSFELSVEGQDFIIDPGTYVYTSDPHERNRFRAARMHNTVMIDGVEMNRKRHNTVFSMHNDAIPRLNRFDSNESHDFLDAEHSGYERLKPPVTHRRTFNFDKKNFTLGIKDYLKGKGTHELEWNFHFAPGIEVSKNGKIITAQKNGVKMLMTVPEELKNHVGIREDDVSPRYGVKEKAKVVTIKLNADLEKSPAFEFVFRAE